MELLLILIGLVILLWSGMPVFAALGLTAVIVQYLAGGGIDGIADVAFSNLNLYMLIALPLFAFMAQIMVRCKVIDDLYAMMQTLVGRSPGGLSVATIGSCAVFAAITGSSAATAMTIGSTAIPQMKRYNYSATTSYGIIAAGGTLGILIPPSGPMILYALISNASIGALFLAGIFPGLLLAGLFAGYGVYRGIKYGEGDRGESASLTEIMRSLRASIWALLLPPVILGGLYFGIFTATEAAAAGAITAILIARFAYGRMDWNDLKAAALETVRISASLFLIIAMAAIFGHVLTINRIPAEVIEALAALDMSPIVFLFTVMALIFVLGMFLEALSIILVAVPIVLPLLDYFQINLVWFGVLLMINLELSMITPPVGLNLFLIKGITNAPMAEIMRGSLPFVLLMLIGLILVAMLPDIALWLPNTTADLR